MLEQIDYFLWIKHETWGKNRVLKFWSAVNKSSSSRASTSGPSLSAPSTANDGLTPQEKYDYLSEYGAHILCLLSNQKGCTYLSKNFETITGHRCGEQIGNHFYDIIHRDYHDRLHELLRSSAPDGAQQKLRC